MKINKFALQIALISLILLSFIACDKDFASLESDIINEDNATNFNNVLQKYDVITYTKALGPVQTNGLGLNNLGVYDDVYGRTTSSFVTQVTASVFAPEFGDGVKIDSVVLNIPYFNTVLSSDEDGNITYDIDSVIGRNPIKLSLFESNYFLRDFDPNEEFGTTQPFFSNKSASESENIPESLLEGELLTFLSGTATSYSESTGLINISEEGYVLTQPNDDPAQDDVVQRISPGIRIQLDTTFWRSKIIDKEGDAVLASSNNFAEYFRGLYFKAEAVGDDNSFLILNTAAASSNITIYYERLTSSTTDDATATEKSTYVLSFGPNRVNFMENDFDMPINTGDEDDGDSRLFIKGGEGSVAKIKLFNGDNVFEDFKNTFVETDGDGNFVASKRLVNEANLIFYVDQDMVENGEPDRLYIYDTENNTPLIDYFLDIDNAIPAFSKFSHLGPLQRVDDEPNGDGIKYKIKITEHINNLLLRDSTNVDLGLAVSLNVNLEELQMQRQVQTSDESDVSIPVSSIISPRGTVLHGNKTNNQDKKVFLEIYYTEPKN